MQLSVLEPEFALRPSPFGRANILGVGIHAINMENAQQAIEEVIARRRKGYICVTNVHVVMEAQKSAEFKQLLNSSFLTVPDGRPLVWVGRLQGSRVIEQVGGPELMVRICELSSRKGYTHFFYGGAPGVAEELRNRFMTRYPGLEVVGVYSPPFRPLTAEEEDELRELFNRLKPDITWVGLGAPKQELFMANYLRSLNTTIMIGVGAAFDMHTGRISDAPYWAKRCGVAWLFRLAQEPRRLFGRYLRTNPRFLWKVFLQLTGLQQYALPDTGSDTAE